MRDPHIHVHVHRGNVPQTVLHREAKWRTLPRLRRVFPTPIPAPAPSRARNAPTWRFLRLRLWFIPVRRRRCRPGRIRVLIVQKALVEPEPGRGSARRNATEARGLVHVVVFVFAKGVVQLLRARRAATAMRHRAERHVVAGKRAVVLRDTTTTLRGAPTEEHAREDAKEDHDSRCAEDPLLVRDQGGHVGEPAFVRCGHHRPTRSGAR